MSQYWKEITTNQRQKAELNKENEKKSLIIIILLLDLNYPK